MQIVDYETADWADPSTGELDAPAALLLATEGTVQRLPLEPGTDLAYTLGERYCAGVVNGTTHHSCPRTDAPYCSVHTTMWPCARCRGDCDKPIENCEQEHVVYLAAFAPDTVKVGVTKSWRLHTRLREQGADRAAHLRTVENGRIARQIEAEIATDLTDRVRVTTKLSGLHQHVNERAWVETLTEFDPKETFDFDYGFDLDAAPTPATMATGTVVGVQGRVLVLAHEGTTYAVDLRELVGYGVSAGATEKALQSGLDAF